MAERLVCIAIFVTLAACASDRPARSSHGCMAKTVQQHIPVGLPDRLAHCLAAGLIARHCSHAEANLASVGKELRDMLGRGDASGADWRASRMGIARAEGDEELRSCCEKKAAP